MSTQQEIRDANLAYLNQHGFQPATWMPLPAAVGETAEEVGFAGGVLRPERDIANRLLCHVGVFAWGSAPSEYGEPISAFIDDNSLNEFMTEDELAIIGLSKDDASDEHADIVGWRLENMWSLAWILGLADPPSAITGQLPKEVTDHLIGLFLPDFLVNADSLLAGGALQPVDEVIRMEDLFYLAHNAVRSGQSGETDRLPEGFHPIADGGAIHERRHSLTWALAPGASWDETDLST